MKEPKSAFLFPNGNVAVFDENGQQIGELQVPWIRLLLNYWQAQGVDPKVIEKMSIVGWSDLTGPQIKMRPFLGGVWNVEIKGGE